MDPNANLKEQRQIARAILANPQHYLHGPVRLAELVQALDEWMRKGGFTPEDWK